MGYSIEVIVTDKHGRSLKGQSVNAYGKNKITTDSNGRAVITGCTGSSEIYVNGATAYEGNGSTPPKQIIITKGRK